MGCPVAGTRLSLSRRAGVDPFDSDVGFNARGGRWTRLRASTGEPRQAAFRALVHTLPAREPQLVESRSKFGSLACVLLCMDTRAVGGRGKSRQEQRDCRKRKHGSAPMGRIDGNTGHERPTRTAQSGTEGNPASAGFFLFHDDSSTELRWTTTWLAVAGLSRT